MVRERRGNRCPRVQSLRQHSGDLLWPRSTEYPWHRRVGIDREHAARRPGAGVVHGKLVRCGASEVTVQSRTLVLGVLAMLAGCASAPPAAPEPATARASDEVAFKATAYAKEMLGKPYMYAGEM